MAVTNGWTTVVAARTAVRGGIVPMDHIPRRRRNNALPSQECK